MLYQSASQHPAWFLQLLQLGDGVGLENIHTTPSPLDCFVDPSTPLFEANLEIPVELYNFLWKHFDFWARPFLEFLVSFLAVSLNIFLNHTLWLTAILIENC